MEEKLLRLLKKAPTIKDAFKVLKKNNIEFKIGDAVEKDPARNLVILVQKVYAVIGKPKPDAESEFYIRGLHPYGSKIIYYMNIPFQID